MENEEEEVGTDMGYTRIHIQYKYDGRGEGGENYTHNNAHNIALGKSRPSGQVREKERSSYYSSLPYIFLFSLPVFGIRLKVTGCFKKAGSAQSSR